MGTGAQTENGGFSRRRFLQGAGGAMLVAPALWIKPGFASELPAQVHLEFGSEPFRQMVVSWSTSAAVSRPRVKLGTAHGGFGRVIPAETRTYVDGAQWNGGLHPPTNPAETGKAREYDSFTLRRRRSDGESEQEKQAERSALASG
jgi:hypothetical protein